MVPKCVAGLFVFLFVCFFFQGSIFDSLLDMEPKVCLKDIVFFVVFGFFLPFLVCWFVCLRCSFLLWFKVEFLSHRCAVRSLIRKQRCGSETCKNIGSLDTVSLTPLHRLPIMIQIFLLRLFKTLPISQHQSNM